MNWTKESGPNEEISYNHIKLSTPLGEFVIDWKGWKEYPSYSIELDGTYLECEDSLEDAKEFVETYLQDVTNKLNAFMEQCKENSKILS